jgi:hypothetical protein
VYICPKVSLQSFKVGELIRHLDIVVVLVVTFAGLIVVPQDACIVYDVGKAVLPQPRPCLG